jgi:hypothetical protein
MQRKLDAWSPREPTAKNDPDNMTTTKTSKVNLECGARHESAHIVIAAEEGWRLKPEGLMVDPSGRGLACYHDAPEETDAARERNILAALAGFALENRFREERSYPPRDYLDVLTAVRAEGFADRRAPVPNLWECGPARFHFSVSTQLEILVYESHMRLGDTVQTGQSELAKRRQSLDDEPFAYRQPKASSSFLSFS